VVAGSKLNKVHIDGGNGLNVLITRTLKKMKLDITHMLTKSTPPFYGIVPRNTAIPLGSLVLGKLVFGSIALVRPRWETSSCIRFRSRERTLRCMSTNETLMPLMPYEFCCAGKTH
jgi:hypothetical protein